jgi:small subunit ribosomal protein S12
MTIQQLIRHQKRLKKHQKTFVPALSSCPQKKGICVKIRIVKPKKPNSAQRKVAKVRLSNQKIITAAIPGQGHNLKEYSEVLVRGGRANDLPGVRYKLIKGCYSFDTFELYYRSRSRSKYGLKRK